MLIDTRTAVYVLAVAAAIGGLPPDFLTDRCPECDERLTDLDSDEHLVVRLPDTDPHSRRAAVVVGCEGYWVVNPALAGIDAPNWMTPEQCIAGGNCMVCGESADHQHCVNCGDGDYTLSTRRWCHGCEADPDAFITANSA